MHYLFSIYNYFIRCTECQVLIKAQKYVYQLYVILATGSENLGRLNRRLSELLAKSSLSPEQKKQALQLHVSILFFSVYIITKKSINIWIR